MLNMMSVTKPSFHKKFATRSTVMAFGTFDHFHAGHESYLKQARELGDRFIVIIARDETVKNIKGRKPDHTERQRRDAVKASGLADQVVVGNSGDKYEVLRKYKPNVIALGYDQFTFTFRLGKFLIDNKMNVQVIRLQAYQPLVYKTSLIRNQLLTKTYAES